jgi:hypothetical protein
VGSGTVDGTVDIRRFRPFPDDSGDG